MTDSEEENNGNSVEAEEEEFVDEESSVSDLDDEEADEPVTKKVKTTKEKVSKTADKSSSKAAKSTVTASKATIPIASAPMVSSNGMIDITQGPPITTDTAAKKLVLQYLKQQNRPYSVLQIHDNLHKRIPKPSLERVLTSLTQQNGGVCCKEYGKAKIYFADQAAIMASFDQNKFSSLLQENEVQNHALEALLATEKNLKSELARLQSEPEDEALQKMLEEVSNRVSGKRERVTKLSESAGGKVDPAGLSKAIKRFNKMRTGWFVRRGMVNDVVEMISDGLNKKTKDVIADLCIETDADYKVTLPPAMKDFGVAKR